MHDSDDVSLSASALECTLYMMLSLLGGDAMTKGLSIESLCFTTSNVSAVAVAVKAITLTEEGTKLRRSPIWENASLKWSPQLLIQCASSTANTTRYFTYFSDISILLEHVSPIILSVEIYRQAELHLLELLSLHWYLFEHHK